MKKYVLLLILPILFVMASCEDFIEIDQPDVVEQDQNFEDLQTVRSSIMGIYSVFAGTVESQFLAGEVRADLVNATPGANYFIREFNTSSFSPSNPYISPKPYYKIIVNANEILGQIDKTLSSGAIDTSEYYGLRGELLSMRAWANLEMLKMYGKCKYITSPMDEMGTPTGGYLEKDSVLSLILTDLEEADALYVGVNKAEWERVRISRFYINVLLGEAYLEKGMFRKAADKFFEVIRKGDDRFGPAGTDVAYYHKFKLTSKFANDNWKKIFYKNWIGVGAYEEYLFYIGFSSQYDQTNKLQDWTASSHGSYQVKPSDWITGQLNDLDDPYRGMGVSIKKDWDHNLIINKYNISRADFDKSLQFYGNNPDGLEAIYDEVIANLRAKYNAYNKRKSIFDIPSIIIREDLKNVKKIKKTDIWSSKKNWHLPQDGKKNIIKYERKLPAVPATYILFAEYLVYPDDSTVGLQMLVYIFYKDGSHNTFIDNSFVKDGKWHKHKITAETNPKKLPERIVCKLANHKKGTKIKHLKIRDVSLLRVINPKQKKLPPSVK